MSSQPVTFFVRRLYRSNQEAMLSSVADVDDESLRWRPARTNSIAFNLWHCARWADQLASILGEATAQLSSRFGSRPEIWHAERLAERWGFPSERLGHVETGMGMDEDLSAQLPLLDLRRATWLKSEEEIGQVLGWILTYARHDARHLGMNEALKGARGMRGTATA